MADFTIDVSRSKTSRINLGIQGENIIEHIIFNISSWIEEFGEGVAYIYAQRKGDENPYPVALDMDLDAGTATWTITDADTAIKGKGKAQLVFVSDDEDSITDVEVYSSSSTYSVGDYCLYGTQLYKCKTTISTAEAWTPAHWDAVNEVKKTRVYATTVQASLVSTSSENPDAYETWLEVLGGYTARIEAAEDDIRAWVTAQINAIDFPVDDVQIDGTSVVSGGVAEIPPNVQPDWNQTNTSADDYIKNKPGNATAYTDGFLSAANKRKLDSIEYSADVTPGVATTTSMGLMSSSDKSKLNGIETGAEANVQSDWNQTDTSADDYIKNKPAIVQKPTYKQTFTASGVYNLAYFDIPYVESYSVEDLLNAKIYYFSANRASEANYFYVSKYNKNGVDVWRYTVYFGMSCESGSTVVFENMFTDTDAEYTGLASM